jgi:class I fructose-bisphosphate aldolase
VSILRSTRGIEHSGGASFAPNPIYFDPENLVELAVEGGCNAFASTLGVLGAVSRKWAHKFPFIVKLNHNEFLSYPNAYDQIMFSSVSARGRWARPASARRSTSARAVQAPARRGRARLRGGPPPRHVHRALVLPAQLAFKIGDTDYHLAADLTGQANHLGVTIQADIIKQKLPRTAWATRRSASSTARTARRTSWSTRSSRPTTRSTCPLPGHELLPRPAGLINSGGASSGETDLQEAVKTAVINKRAGGMGLISGRKAFQRPMDEGIGLLNAIQDVYLSPEVTVA